jgi:hypothetical protein
VVLGQPGQQTCRWFQTFKGQHQPGTDQFREAISHDGRLYAAAARDPPGTWRGESGADGGLFVSEDEGETFESVSYPGQPQEVVLAWTIAEGNVVAGTNEGRVLLEGNDGWETAGQVASGDSIAMYGLISVPK